MNNKYLLAGSIIAGVGIIYATSKKIDSDVITDLIDKNKEKFQEIIDELVAISLEVLEKIITFIKKIIIQLTFKFKMI